MSDRETVREGYETLAETYAASRSVDGRELAILGEFLRSCSDSARVLDAGCGQGSPILRRVSDRTAAVGLDFSRAQLRLAVEATPGTPLVQGEMTRLPFHGDAFDAVVAYNSVIHVPLADHQTVLDEFARVLRTGGRLLLSEASEEFRRTNTDWLDSGVEMTWEMAGATATREQLAEAGFEVVREWPAPKPDSSGPKPPFFSARLGT